MTDAQVVIKLAGLLQAGLSLRQAQQVMASELAQMQPETKEQISELLAIAKHFGGSAERLLEAVADRLENENRLLDQIALAAASPRATARLVSWLPVVCLGLAQLLGINVMATVGRNPVASISMLIGIILLVANNRWVKRLTAAAELKTKTQVAGLKQLSALTLQLTAGVAASSIRQQKPPPEVDELFELAQIHGIALLPLLHAQLRHLELRARFEVERGLAALGVKLLLPIGLLVLPALVFLAVIPTGLALVSAKSAF